MGRVKEEEKCARIQGAVKLVPTLDLELCEVHLRINYLKDAKRNIYPSAPALPTTGHGFPH